VLFSFFLLFFLFSLHLDYAAQGDVCTIGVGNCGTGSGSAGDCAKGEQCIHKTCTPCGKGCCKGGGNFCNVDLKACKIDCTDISGACGGAGQCHPDSKCVSGSCVFDASCVKYPPPPPPPAAGSHPDFVYAGLKFKDLQVVLAPIAKILYYAALVVGVLFIIYSGYIIMTSEGNPQQVQQGQEQLTAAILGIIFILLSAAILRVIITSILGETY
jgi:hypothetical protein